MTEPMNQALGIIELREELQRTKLLLQNCNGDIVRADRELASLREQLKLSKEIGIERGEQLKQQEEVVRELIEALVSASECLESEGYQQFPEEINAVIDYAKSLTTKDK